ncbi:hypothetical protein SAMN04515671_1797 [Nakamurella panacisegetis]|uniref:ANTAR domain-containing protein n=1 Tax=Nakamurella panacisegetis TaxID=1090615 RepID=A0A1H0LTZ4_9ACTN|nr:ANTAR domain-containing protein [Nakamurella panacisegetis]SDO71466.1 hypothetical protein SAMN04515671_1797 [Nakamurella panacisegetis]
MTEQFAAARRSAARSADGPEMLAVQLSMACVDVLPVDGAGISVFSSRTFRAPIGASNPGVAAAERLQFTTGEGPCLSAHASGDALVASESDMQARWPAFHAELVSGTPFRAIASFPLKDGLFGLGALDLYFRVAARLDQLRWEEAGAVAALVAQTLAEQPFRATLSGEPAPDWLESPLAVDRTMVSIAMGMLTVAAELSFGDALAVLRAHAFGTNRTVDEVSADVVHRSLPIDDLDLTYQR